MAKSRPRKTASRSAPKSRRTLYSLLAILAVLVAVGWYFRTPATGYAQAGTSYMARVGCSCRFVAGRSLDDCAKDKMSGMELVTLTEDDEAKSVTARFPLIASDTAFYREGYGCVLQPWED